ncbi:Signal transduction histidine kinase CheA [Geitlerinema sp. FC II]|nr:Signal transduction histidine kinase CheA [Geitlerinema sp. FC II]
MTIEDEELQGIFKEASEEELRNIKNGLSVWQQHPSDRDVLEDLLRNVHSLKGNAGMLGLKDLAMLTNQWEHVLETLKQSDTSPSEDVFARLQQGLEAIEKLVNEAITGEPSGVQTFYVLAALMGGHASPPPSDAPPETLPESPPPPPASPSPRVSHSDPSQTYLDDEELRQTFQIASEDHLQKLDDGLLHLEQHPDDGDRLDDILREIHSLKGDAGMLGVESVAQLAHLWEQQLAPVKEKTLDLSPQLFDRLYGGLDAIRQFVNNAVSGEVGSLSLETACHVLRGEEPSVSTPDPSPTEPATPPPSSTEPATPYIEDEELRRTFKLASEDHLQQLYDGLLHLEQHPDDRDRLDDILREIHSLKGDAGMLGVENIARLSHAWEHQLTPVKEGKTDLTDDLCDRLFRDLDTIRQQISDAVTPPLERPDSTSNGSSDTASAADDRSVPSSEIPYIEDDELRHTFRIACDDHLQQLEDGLLHLEEHPDDGDRLDRVLREIHSIKGDAGMLGIDTIARLAHDWEQHLVPIKQDNVPLTPQLCDRLYRELDRIRQLVNEAVTGRRSPVEPDTAVDRPDSGPQSPTQTVAIAPAPAATSPNPSSDSSPNGNVQNDLDGNYRIDTIRVATHNLDALMTQTGELTVTKIRIAHRLSEIEEIVSLWEEWSRDTNASRFLWEEFRVNGRENGNGTRANVLEQMQSFQQLSRDRLERMGNLVNRLRNAIAEDTARLDTISDEIEDGVRTLRLLPLSTIFNLYPRLVRDLARSQNKNVRLSIWGGDTRADKRILEEMKDPLTHIIRNAIDHGIELPEERVRLGKPERATVTLRGYQTASTVAIEVSDDGRGLDLEKIKKTALKNGVCRPEDLETMTPNQIRSLIFMPGFSTRSFVTEVSGRGVGLDVVHANVERLKGSIQVESEPGKGCTIRLHLGTTLATAHVLLVEVNGQPYALPVEFVQTACTIDPSDIFAIEGRETILFGDRPISVATLADLLELPEASEKREARSSALSCIILKVGDDWLGVIVDRLIDEQDAILKPQSKLLARVRNVSGATILGTGEVCIVLNPVDLVQSLHSTRRLSALTRDTTSVSVASEDIGVEPPEDRPRAVVLLVEDSITTRTQEKRILEAAGYEVVTAVDGLDGYNKLRAQPFDAVVSDIQMPNLDGLKMTERIRSHQQYSELPIVLVTSLGTDEDRRKGAEAGANAYITKSSFDREVLVETLRRLV